MRFGIDFSQLAYQFLPKYAMRIEILDLPDFFLPLYQIIRSARVI